MGPVPGEFGPKPSRGLDVGFYRNQGEYPSWLRAVSPSRHRRRKIATTLNLWPGNAYGAMHGTRALKSPQTAIHGHRAAPGRPGFRPLARPSSPLQPGIRPWARVEDRQEDELQEQPGEASWLPREQVFLTEKRRRLDTKMAGTWRENQCRPFSDQNPE